MEQPVVLGPGEGEPVGALTIKVGREEFAMTESRYDPGRMGPDPHSGFTAPFDQVDAPADGGQIASRYDFVAVRP